MKKNAFSLCLALVIIISLILVGCSSTPSSTPPPASTTSAPPASSSAPPKTTTTAPASTTTSAPSTTAPAAGTIKLKYADQNPAEGWEGSHAAQPWLDQMTKATNGKVTFETYYNQTLFKGTDAWESTKSDVADVAWMFHGYWANMTPLADVISLPLYALHQC